jgi:hypothetical protein
MLFDNLKPIDSTVLVSLNERILFSKFLPAPVQKNIKAENLKFSDSIVNNASTTEHGFLPKLPGDPAKFLDGNGNFTAPSSGGMTQPQVLARISFRG